LILKTTIKEWEPELLRFWKFANKNSEAEVLWFLELKRRPWIGGS
jgi:hypothetical protein